MADARLARLHPYDAPTSTIHSYTTPHVQLSIALGRYQKRTKDLGKEYLKHGDLYHSLPNSVRLTRYLVTPIHAQMLEAFTISSTREPPNVIQILGQLEQAFDRVGAALQSGDYASAALLLRVAGDLISEAIVRIWHIGYAMRVYEQVLESTRIYFWQGEDARPCAEWQMVARVRQQRLWREALPKIVAGAERSIQRQPRE